MSELELHGFQGPGTEVWRDGGETSDCSYMLMKHSIVNSATC